MPALKFLTMKNLFAFMFLLFTATIHSEAQKADIIIINGKISNS